MAQLWCWATVWSTETGRNQTAGPGLLLSEHRQEAQYYVDIDMAPILNYCIPENGLLHLKRFLDIAGHMKEKQLLLAHCFCARSSLRVLQDNVRLPHTESSKESSERTAVSMMFSG